MKDENSPVRTTDATQEHVVARWRGGKRIWENLVAACSFCNHARPKDVSAYEFISPYILEKRKIENKKEKQRLKNARRRLRRKQLDASFKQFMDMVPAV